MTTLVTGATGNVGRQVVAQLTHAGEPVRALTRDPARAYLPPELTADTVEVVAGDLAAPHTLTEALDQVTGMHLITTSGTDPRPLSTLPEVLWMARRAGVARMSVLCGNATTSVPDVVRASGLEGTLLEPDEFMVNALEWASSIRTEGVVREPFGGMRGAPVHEADVAAVAVAALLEDEHAGQTYTLTGPHALTVPEAVGTIASVIGRPVTYIELTVEQARQRWREQGHCEEGIKLSVELGLNTPLTAYTVLPTVEQVTGRPARTFAHWVAEHADAFNGT